MAEPRSLDESEVELTPKGPKVQKVNRGAVWDSSSGTKAPESRDVAEWTVRLVQYQSTSAIPFHDVTLFDD